MNSLVQKAGVQLRRVFLRHLTKPAVFRLEALAQTPSVVYNSPKIAFNISAGSREPSITDFGGGVSALALRPQCVTYRLGLFNHDNFGYVDVTVVDGIASPDPQVFSGAVTTAAAVSGSVTLAKISRGNDQNCELKLICRGGDGLLERRIMEWWTKPVSVVVAIPLPNVFQPELLVTFQKANVRTVPESVERTVPLVRSREPNPLANSLAELVSWIPEKNRLAESAGNGVTSKDIQVVAIFRRIPLSFASRIELGPGLKTLRVYLRPLAANMVQSGNRPMYSIAFGQVRGKPEIIRALIPD